MTGGKGRQDGRGEGDLCSSYHPIRPNRNHRHRRRDRLAASVGALQVLLAQWLAQTRGPRGLQIRLYPPAGQGLRRLPWSAVLDDFMNEEREYDQTLLVTGKMGRFNGM